MKSEVISATIRDCVLPKMSAVKAAGGKLDVQGVSDLLEKYPDSPEVIKLSVLAIQQTIGERNARYHE